MLSSGSLPYHQSVTLYLFSSCRVSWSDKINFIIYLLLIINFILVLKNRFLIRYLA